MRGTKLRNPLFSGKEKKFLIPQWKWYQWTRTDLSISVIHFFFVLGGPIKNVHEKTAKIDQKWYFMLNNFILLVIMLFFLYFKGHAMVGYISHAVVDSNFEKCTWKMPKNMQNFENDRKISSDGIFAPFFLM